MKASTKRAMIVAAGMLLLGVILAAAGFFGMGASFRPLETVSFSTREYAPEEPFDAVSIRGGSCDVKLLPSEDGTCRVVCREEDGRPFRVAAEKGVLSVEETNTDKYQLFRFSAESPEITVYLPIRDYERFYAELSTGDLRLQGSLRFDSFSVEGSTGDVTVDGASIGALTVKRSTGSIRLLAATVGSAEVTASSGGVSLRDMTAAEGLVLQVTTGDIHLENVTCGSLNAKAGTGDIELKDSVARGEISLRSGTGHLLLADCDAASLRLSTNTGDVSGHLLSDKIYTAKANTGSVSVPSSRTGGECSIETNTGDIRFD